MNSYQIKVGTLSELTGQGEEWLLDESTRTTVIARFYNGNFIRSTSGEGSTEKTITLDAA